MPAGRPHSSTTPAWRSKPAIRVCLYHYLCYLFRKPPTKYGCAKEMGISRTTAIKWFETMRWNKEQHERYWAIRSWAISHMHLECRYDRFNNSKKERRIQWIEFESSLIGTKETRNAGYVQFAGHKYGQQSYLLTIPASELEKGEYGIFYMSIITATAIPVATFGVK